MRKIKKIVSIFMIAAVAFTVAVSNTNISAADEVDVEVSITKEIVTGEGVSLDANSQFDFDIDLTAVSTGTFSESKYDGVRTLDTSIGFGTGDTGSDLVNESNNLLDSKTYPHAGVYVYKVTESSTSGNGYIVGGETYTMFVFAYNKSSSSSSTGYDGTYIHNVIIVKGDVAYEDLESVSANDKVDGTPTTTNSGNGFRFKNYYNEDADLELKKVVEGDLVNLNDEYEFTVAFTFPDSVVAGSGYTYAGITYKIDNATSTSGNVENDGTVVINLKAGETVTFSDLPAGTTYTVTEDVPVDFTATADVIEAGSQFDESKVEVSASGQVLVDREDGKGMVGSILVGEKNGSTAQNKVVYTNTETDVSITGLIIDNLPFIALMGVGIVGLVYIALNKKRKSI